MAAVYSCRKILPAVSADLRMVKQVDEVILELQLQAWPLC